MAAPPAAGPKKFLNFPAQNFKIVDGTQIHSNGSLPIHRVCQTQ
jgi:hypothetical protein